MKLGKTTILCAFSIRIKPSSVLSHQTRLDCFVVQPKWINQPCCPKPRCDCIHPYGSPTERHHSNLYGTQPCGTRKWNPHYYNLHSTHKFLMLRVEWKQTTWERSCLFTSTTFSLFHCPVLSVPTLQYITKKDRQKISCKDQFFCYFGVPSEVACCNRYQSKDCDKGYHQQVYTKLWHNTNTNQKICKHCKTIQPWRQATRTFSTSLLL